MGNSGLYDDGRKHLGRTDYGIATLLGLAGMFIMVTLSMTLMLGKAKKATVYIRNR